MEFPVSGMWLLICRILLLLIGLGFSESEPLKNVKKIEPILNKNSDKSPFQNLLAWGMDCYPSGAFTSLAPGQNLLTWRLGLGARSCDASLGKAAFLAVGYRFRCTGILKRG